jgi:hypothetical protein
VTASRLALIGLPGTGKTTYMGTLWHMAEEPSVADITETAMPVSPRHIQRIAAKVRAVEDLPRTNHDDDDFYEGTVAFPDGGTVVLRIHDRSGEQLQALVERRQWPSLLAGEVAAAQALILFVSDDKLILPLSLRLAEGLADNDPAKLAADESGAGGATAAAAAEDTVAVADAAAEEGAELRQQPAAVKTYAHHYASTAAQLVDGLENVLEEMVDDWPVRIAVVVSKFDRVSQRTPAQWFDERLPALAAFLDNNPSRATWRLFGVCALGGRPEDRDELVQQDLHERAWARDANGDEVPLSEPVRWALGWV